MSEHGSWCGCPDCFPQVRYGDESTRRNAAHTLRLAAAAFVVAPGYRDRGRVYDWLRARADALDPPAPAAPHATDEETE